MKPLWYEDRKNLFETLCAEQNGRCALTGDRVALEMHEWLVKRSDLPIVRLQGKIFHRYNCILISHAQHSRSDYNQMNLECAKYAIEKYGKEQIEDWLISLNLKTFGTLDQYLFRLKL